MNNRDKLNYEIDYMLQTNHTFTEKFVWLVSNKLDNLAAWLMSISAKLRKVVKVINEDKNV